MNAPDNSIDTEMPDIFSRCEVKGFTRVLPEQALTNALTSGIAITLDEASNTICLAAGQEGPRPARANFLNFLFQLRAVQPEIEIVYF